MKNINSNKLLEIHQTHENPENYKVGKSTLPDHIAGSYKLKLANPLPALSNVFSQAYEVEDIEDAGVKNLYASVINKKYPFKISVINALKKARIKNLIAPIFVEIVTLSTTGEENLVIIFEKPPGPESSLKNYIEDKGSCTPNFIVNNVLIPAISIINELDSLAIIHGKINLDNLFINSTGQLVIGEFVTEPCGYSQNYNYETIARMGCKDFAKGSSDSSIDYFALGIVCLYLYLGKAPPSKDNIEKFNEKRLIEGSFKAFVGNILLPTYLINLIKGLLVDKDKDRWKFKQITEWYNSKNIRILNNETIESKKHLLFNNKHYLNRRSLVNDFSKNWDLAKSFVKGEDLIKWVDRGLYEPVMAEKLTEAIKSFSTLFGSNDKDSLLTKAISIIDPQGPIRIKSLTIFLDAVPNLIAFAFAENKNEYFEYLNKILHSSVWKGNIIDIKKYQSQNEIENILLALDESREFIKNNNLGYGVERCLYELNRFLPCQSPIFQKEFILNAENLLNSLEIKSENSKNVIIDKHIAAFILSKTESNMTKILAPLYNYPEFAHNPELNILAIFAMGQKKHKISKLVNLSKAVANNFDSYLDLLKNKKIKTNLQEKLKKLASSGSMVLMLNYLLKPDYIINDIIGLKKAAIRYEMLEEQKSKLALEDKVSEIGYRYGLKLTVIISYLLCTLVLLSLLLNIKII